MISETKQAIAAAVSAVDGVQGYSSRPGVLRPGDAFVRWGGWQRAEGTAFYATFRVVVVLDQGSETTADESAYALADTLEAALRPVMFVDAIEPTILPTEAGDMFSLTITGRTE